MSSSASLFPAQQALEAACPALAYIPLGQSFLVAMGTVVAAAIIVWGTNTHARNREEKQAQRTKNLERQKVLREKVEDLMNACEAAYMDGIATARHIVQFTEARRLKEPAPTNTMKKHQDFVADVSTAVVISQLYFPTLVDAVGALFRELLGAALILAGLVEAGTQGTPAPPLAVPDDLYAKAKQLRSTVMGEARRLIENDFDLKD